MKHLVYYVGRNGELYNRRQMEVAFYLLTGVSATEHEGRFLAFLYSRIGNGGPIAYYFTPSVEDLVRVGRTVEATQMYRKEVGCGLSEAYRHVQQIHDDMCKKGEL